MVERRREPYDELVGILSRHAPSYDARGDFPKASFESLHARGLIADPPRRRGKIAAMLSLLSAVGRGDLNVGRLFEGHINALFLFDRFATPEQRDSFQRQASAGGIFGVWNTDAPGNPLVVENGRLNGAKSFASGIDGLSAAIVTVEGGDGRQMLVAPTEVFSVDRSWWRTSGMRASGSHVAEAQDVPVDPHTLLGKPGDYVAEPWFSGGALRFVAVQAGGMHAVFDCVSSHLRKTKRASNPYQSHRLARIGADVETAYVMVNRAAQAWEEALAAENDAAKASRFLAAVHAVRAVVEDRALSVLETAERAVGAAGFNAPHPLERLDRDLRTYLRQPNPDGSLAALGAAIDAGAWAPSFTGKRTE